MKIRKGFVSNSSSSSFVISKHFMTDEQVKEFSNFIDTLDNAEYEYDQYFEVRETKYYFHGGGDRGDKSYDALKKLEDMGIESDKIVEMED